jgi:glycosyltransferase involved in cell wall biosynthesis
MSYGVPVITSNTSSMPEVGGDAVLYVDPLDIFDIEHAIRKLLNDESVRNSFINKGLQQAKIFSWKIMCEEIVSSYNITNH